MSGTFYAYPRSFPVPRDEILNSTAPDALDTEKPGEKIMRTSKEKMDYNLPQQDEYYRQKLGCVGLMFPAETAGTGRAAANCPHLLYY